MPKQGTGRESGCLFARSIQNLPACPVDIQQVKSSSTELASRLALPRGKLF